MSSSSSTPTATATQEQFDSAAGWLSGNPAAAGLSNEVKLELYGLYKYVTSDEPPPRSRPSIFYPTLRAKYDSFVSVHTHYSTLLNTTIAETKSQARGRYVNIARGVGWTGEVEEEIDLEKLDDESGSEAEEGPASGDGGVQGKDKGKGKATNAENAWRSVSVMAEQGDIEGEEDGDEEDELSPIHEAVISDAIDEVKRLLAQDPALINARDDFGYTPLHLAADRGYPEITRLLLLHGADKEAKDEDDQTPLMLAEISSRDDIIAILRGT
ncbi:hypothetical protein CI109_105517 [Kwoniella shandongensis]|uniref:ACB domain-containing protein n=1 Tax=Kwoniella shandongensis TaxID=1734106 RepID=A0A5M6C7A9_9TREE|nr:uncharacterized protein CI109_002238 [Kwoniella shandongensis]KAA5529345.1 hypothetical protein CI109_002238 [Kwoniella shandongensis]